MSEKTLNNIRIVHKHDTEENWLKATNFIPKQGELIIYDIDENHNKERFKIGDGKTNVNLLPFGTEDIDLSNYETKENLSIKFNEIENLISQKSQVQFITWEADD